MIEKLLAALLLICISDILVLYQAQKKVWEALRLLQQFLQ